MITKHPGTGGAVTVGTVTAQLLYETAGARYAGPGRDGPARHRAADQDGPDRVRIDGVRGEAPPPTLKVGLTRLGGFRNEVTFVLTGLDIEAKAALVRGQMEAALDAAEAAPPRCAGRWPAPTTRTRTSRRRRARCCGSSCGTRTRTRWAGRSAAPPIELALASYPGFHVTAPPGRARRTGCSRR